MSAATPRVTIQQMIKAAAEGAADHAAVSLEAAQQLAAQGDAPAPEKTASASNDIESIPTEYIEKFASAVEYVLDEMQKEATIGEGPNHLQVLTPQGGKNPMTPGSSGAASPSHQVPKTTSTVNPGNQPAGPSTAMETNKPVAGKQKVSSAPIADIRKLAGAPVAPAAAAPAAAEPKVATVGDIVSQNIDPRLVDLMLSTVKQAEDAINPAHISAGSADSTMLLRSAAGEAGGAPAGGQPQGPTGLVASNDAARNYTKADAKAQVKPQLAKVLSEPALSSAHDNVLQKALSHTGQAGVKISSVRSMAARAVLEKMAEEAKSEEESKKKKESMGGMGSYQAPPVGGAGGAGAGAGA